jgi:hypothetical protein
MFTENDWTNLDIGLSNYIGEMKEVLTELCYDLDYYQKENNEEYIKDIEESITIKKDKISELELLQIKVKQYKLGILK